MQTYCLSCRKRTGNIDSKKKKSIRNGSRCTNCMPDESRFLKQKHNKKVVRIILIRNYLFTNTA